VNEGEGEVKQATRLCPKKLDPIWNEPISTGNAGALARYEREAPNSYSVKKVEIERAAHTVRAMSPAKSIEELLEAVAF
jgi:hypothetical protein